AGGGVFRGVPPRGTRLLHLPAQRLHLGDVEPGIVSDDHDIGGFEDTIKRRDELLLSRSIHRKLFPLGDPASRPGTAGCDPLSEPGAVQNAARTALLRSCPPGGGAGRTRMSRFEPVAGRLSPKTVVPIYAGDGH